MEWNARNVFSYIGVGFGTAILARGIQWLLGHVSTSTTTTTGQ